MRQGQEATPAAAVAAAVVAEGGVEMKTFAMKSATAAMFLGWSACSASAAPAVYESPEAAADAFVAALEAQDRDALLVVFGPEAADLVGSGDAERDAEARKEFLAGYRLFHELDDLSESTRELVIGRTLWPFPVLIVKGDAGWSFDPDEARDEILSRRIGLNELDVIDILNRATTVQAKFRSFDYDEDGVMEYAASILSSPGQRDGLYWPHEDGKPDSPVGADIAMAAADGVSLDGVDQEPNPYMGYYFRILTKQGPDAPGGAYDYMINGNMIAGYAVLAYPADPGNSGVMSFMVGENGVIYQANLGDATLETAGAIDTFNPDASWSKVEQ
jgi:hypothetical protein